MPLRVQIRYMIRRDMPSVLAIENASFQHPWGEDEFLRALRRRPCFGMVAEYGARVVGFMIYERRKGRLHLLDFAVHPEFRRQGVGRQLVAKLVDKLHRHGRTRIALGLEETNLAGLQFFRSQGFRATEVWRSHFTHTGRDAYVMLRELEPENPGIDDAERPRIGQVS